MHSWVADIHAGNETKARGSWTDHVLDGVAVNLVGRVTFVTTRNVICYREL